MFHSDVLNEIKDEFINKKNSHSYMFYTNDFFRCIEDVNNLIKIIFNVDDLDKVKNDLFRITRSSKKNILKDEVVNIKDSLLNTSYFNKNRLYIIEEAHKLNSSSANVILKFLEEPSDGIIGLFITDNLDAVIGTIKSRCQIVNAFYKEKEQEVTDKNIEKLESLLFNNNVYESLMSIKKDFNDLDRSDLISAFNYLIKKYSINLDMEKAKRIRLLNQGVDMLYKNVNVDYVFDYILLKGV